VGTTSQFTGDITLNGASTQAISCSAPTALNIRTTTNSVPINFNCQSSAGTYTEVLKVVADNNPRVITKASEIRFTDSTTTTYQSSIINLGGTATVRNVGNGTGNITLDASQSTAGAGAITLTTKNGTAGSGGGLILTGNTLEAATAGASITKFLSITINGVVYKIALLNNV
jgi:predicted secreted protein